MVENRKIPKSKKLIRKRQAGTTTHKTRKVDKNKNTTRKSRKSRTSRTSRKSRTSMKSREIGKPNLKKKPSFIDPFEFD